MCKRQYNSSTVCGMVCPIGMYIHISNNVLYVTCIIPSGYRFRFSSFIIIIIIVSIARFNGAPVTNRTISLSRLQLNPHSKQTKNVQCSEIET